MGNLCNQPVREQYRVGQDSLEFFLEDAAKFAEKYSTSVEAVVNAKHTLELERQNNIAVQNADHTDEQAGRDW